MNSPSTATKASAKNPQSPGAAQAPANGRVTKFLTVGQATLAYDDTGGSGPLVIALPGMGDLRGEYRFLSTYLDAAGYRVVTVDLRGHGQSSSEWGDYSAHAGGDDVLALMTQLGQEKAIIIGNSFSAGSALWAAHDAPQRVIAAVLIGPVLRDPPKGIPWYMRAALSVGFAGPWRVRFWLLFWTGLFPMRKPADFRQYRDSLGDNLRESGRMNALKTMVYLSKSDTEAMLTNTGMPVLVVMGTKDADFPDPATEAQWLVDRLGAKLLMVQGAGHYPQTETPEEVGPAIVNFLKHSRL